MTDFFIPALKQADSYDRASGYFSSSSLIEVCVGVCDLASRGGKIRMITSPNLTLEDVNAIKRGYDDLENVVGSSMVRSFDKPEDKESIDRL